MPSSSPRTRRARWYAAQRVGLPARAVQRQHQLAPSPLPEGLGRDGLLEIGHELAGLPE